MRPTEILSEEHRVIEVVLDCVEKMADALDRGEKLDAESAREAIDFLRVFADRCHHGKEEDQLFPLMEQRGYSPHEGPTAVMRMEHEQGRALIRRMEQAVEAAGEGFVEAARGYVDLLRAHIQKEDHCLFPMADQALTPEDRDTLLQRFEHVEQGDLGPEVHQRYLGVAESLRKRFGMT